MTVGRSLAFVHILQQQSVASGKGNVANARTSGYIQSAYLQMPPEKIMLIRKGCSQN